MATKSKEIIGYTDCISVEPGAIAEQFGIEEVCFTFDGHLTERERGKRVLNHEELRNGDVSLEYISRLMNRRYTTDPLLRRIQQSIWYQINNGQEIYVVGEILDDKTVKGGTGWGAEFAKLCNKPLHVFDQKQDGWFGWNQQEWVGADSPAISHEHFTGTGTRNLADNGRTAIQGLFECSFGYIAEKKPDTTGVSGSLYLKRPFCGGLRRRTSFFVASFDSFLLPMCEMRISPGLGGVVPLSARN